MSVANQPHLQLSTHLLYELMGWLSVLQELVADNTGYEYYKEESKSFTPRPIREMNGKNAADAVSMIHGAFRNSCSQMQLALTQPEGAFYQQLAQTAAASPLSRDNKNVLLDHLAHIDAKIEQDNAIGKAIGKLKSAINAMSENHSMAAVYDLIETYRHTYRAIYYHLPEESDLKTLFKAFDNAFNEHFTAPFMQQLIDLEHIDLTLRLDDEETVTLRNITNRRAKNSDGNPFSLAPAILALSAGRGQSEPDVPFHLYESIGQKKLDYLVYNQFAGNLFTNWQIIGEEIIGEFEAQFPDRKELSDAVRQQNHFCVGKAQCKAIHDKSVAALKDIADVAEQLQMSDSDKEIFDEYLPALQKLLGVEAITKTQALG